MPDDNAELLGALTAMIAEALKTSIGNAIQQVNTGGQNANEGAAIPSPRIPAFSMSEYRPSDGSSVADYFSRFKWALELSQIPQPQYANYARVHMGAELNNALKFLVSPQDPAAVGFDELQSTLINHFDRKKNKYVESIKFRQIVQQRGEAVAHFVLRLRQAAADCEYGEFLDRMLTEQLLHGLEACDMCDEIIAKKPATFKEAYEIAHTLEATRNTAREVNTGATSAVPEETNKLGYENLRTRKKSSFNQPKSSQGEHQRTNSRPANEAGLCKGCGGQHLRSQCRFQDVRCHHCNIKGHIAKVCRSRRSTVQESSADQVDSQDTPASEIDVVQSLSQVHDITSTEKKMIDVKVDGRALRMELDTGAPCGIIAESKLRLIKPNYSLLKTDRQFSSYTGHRIDCLGRIPVNVSVGATTRRLNLYVVAGESDSLFGREWISHFVEQINLNRLFSTDVSVNSVSCSELTPDQGTRLSSLLEGFEDIFSDIPGKLIGPPAKVHLKPEATPIFAKARDVPHALRERYAAEIDKKLASGFFEKVDFSEWSSPTHIVVKKNGDLRITGNYKPTVNPRMIVDEHPIPKIETIFNKMNGATLFCHLDVTDAYTHLPIDEEFSHILTLNTATHGLIRPTRAVYGAANIPAIWQRRMESILQGLDDVVVSFYDDIIVFARDFSSLLQALTVTLDRLRLNGLRLNRSKCVFATPSLECLGHKNDCNGLHKSDKHIEAIRDAPRPTTPDELQLFLGKATYYSAFIPNLSSRARNLRDMLLADTFEWTADADRAYLDLKAVLTSPQVLMQYDPTLPLVLATDASKTGLGAVLSHRLTNGLDRPIAYASATMSSTEQRYPQIDKEALAIVWAVKKFFHYLYARKFTLITDHKPLTQILHPAKSLPTLCISRMANYADYLAHFDFDIVYKPTKQHTNADYCSRIPSQSSSDISSLNQQEGGRIGDEFDGFVLHQIQQLPVRAEHIAHESRKDAYLGKIVQLLEMGRELTQCGYKSPENRYTLAANCLHFEHRVVVPPVLRQAILNDLHVANLGVVKMKSLARSFVYWPGIDSDIERAVRSCSDCARHAPVPPKFNSHHWEYPKGPWERIHVDYAGPVADSMLLIVVDAYSKWVEVKVISTSTTAATINILDELFSAYGVPTTLVSDNGPQFTATEFKQFLQMSGVKFHKLSAPYHPATNGQAERYVQTVKQALKSMGTTKSSLKMDINEFLRQYRKAAHSETSESPAKLFLGRNIRTRLDLVRPLDATTRITEKQKANFRSSFRSFTVGQKVYFLSGNIRLDKWIPGMITEQLGDLHYRIDYNGKQVKRHVDQIQRFHDYERGKECLSPPISSTSPPARHT